jgi:hypothetical protein
MQNKLVFGQLHVKHMNRQMHDLCKQRVINSCLVNHVKHNAEGHRHEALLIDQSHRSSELS